MNQDPQFLQTIATYNRIAPQYAIKIEGLLAETVPSLERFYQLLKPGDYILDAGCAACRTGAYLVGQGFQVMGIDLSAGLLAEAKKLHPEVPTQLMDMRQLTFADNTFEGIWAEASLLHLDEPGITQALNEFHRVLKPGGYCYIKVKETEVAAKTKEFAFGEERHYYYYTSEQMKKLLERAHFQIVYSHRSNPHQTNSDRRDIVWIEIIGLKKD